MDLFLLILAILTMCAFAAFVMWRAAHKKKRDARVFLAFYLSGKQSGVSAEELRSRLNQAGLSFSHRGFQSFLNQLIKDGSISYENQTGTGIRLYRLPSDNSMREMV